MRVISSYLTTSAENESVRIREETQVLKQRKLSLSMFVRKRVMGK